MMRVRTGDGDGDGGIERKMRPCQVRRPRPGAGWGVAGCAGLWRCELRAQRSATAACSAASRRADDYARSRAPGRLQHSQRQMPNRRRDRARDLVLGCAPGRTASTPTRSSHMGGARGQRTVGGPGVLCLATTTRSYVNFTVRPQLHSSPLQTFHCCTSDMIGHDARCSSARPSTTLTCRTVTKPRRARRALP